MGSFLQEGDQGWGQILQAGILPGKMLGQEDQKGARRGWANHQAREIQCLEEEMKEGRWNKNVKKVLMKPMGSP